MKSTIQLIKNFEKRNNISISVMIHGDESGCIYEFWNEEELFNFETIDELHSYLKDTQYRKDENGICLSPVQEV